MGHKELLPSHDLPPNLPQSISVCTATWWLHQLGYHPLSHKKGAYVDGHEREDVVKCRAEFLKELEHLRETHLPLHLAVKKELPHHHQMQNQRKHWCLFIMMKPSSIQMKGKYGCGQQKMLLSYNLRQRALGLW